MADNELKYFQSVDEIKKSMTTPVEAVINLNKNYLYVDSPVAFYLISNDGHDISYFPIGGWTFDCYKLLPKKYRELNPVFTMSILYDSILLGDGQSVIINTTDVAFFDSATSLFGQTVTDTKAVEALAENRVQNTEDIQQQTESISQDISQQSVDIADSISTNVESLKTGLTQQTIDIETAIKVISDTLGSNFRSFLGGYLQDYDITFTEIRSQQDAIKGVIGGLSGTSTLMQLMAMIGGKCESILSVLNSLSSYRYFNPSNLNSSVILIDCCGFFKANVSSSSYYTLYIDRQGYLYSGTTSLSKKGVFMLASFTSSRLIFYYSTDSGYSNESITVSTIESGIMAGRPCSLY